MPTTPQSQDRNSQPTTKAAAMAICLVALCVVAIFSSNLGCQRSLESKTEPAEGELVDSAQLASAPVMNQGRHRQGVSAHLKRRDPSKDDWQSELLAENLASQLRQFAALVEDSTQIATDSVGKICSPKLKATELRPDQLEIVYTDEVIEVSRMVATARPKLRDVTSFAETIKQLAEPFSNLSDVHAKFKVTHVETVEGGVNSALVYSAYGSHGDRTTQQTATWKCNWQLADEDSLPMLKEVTVTAFEEIRGPKNSPAMFNDKTAAVFANEPLFDEQLRHGVNYWQARLQNTVGLDFIGHQGIALGDVNQDGLDDLFVCQPGGLPNRLFLHQIDGTLLDASERLGVDMLDSTSSALLIDLDNDGYQDLVTVSSTRISIFRNHGGREFRRQTQNTFEVSAAFSVSAADYDADGLLDLYVCGYSYPTGKVKVPIPYHDANNGYRNWLLKNEGEFVFHDVTGGIGLDDNNRRYSFSSAWEDYDNDGDLDLYVVNDYGRNNLYRNDEGRFSDVAAEAGVEDISAGMSVTWGDYNNDGNMDIYVSNMFSSAGQRVTYNRRFRHADNQDLKLYQRHARGNSLFSNRGDGTFEDVTLEQNVALGRWAWGSLFGDLNNDGWQDLAVCNGNLTGPETDDL